MQELESLATSLGYSWSVGHYTAYRCYMACAHKEMPPRKIRCIGGGDVTLFQYRLCAYGESVEEAIRKLIILLKEEPVWPTWPKHL